MIKLTKLTIGQNNQSTGLLDSVTSIIDAKNIGSTIQ